MTNEIIFQSDAHPGGEMVFLACGYVSLNSILFAKENITVTLEAKTGEISFSSPDSPTVTAKVAVPLSGDEKFSEVQCSVEGALIKLGFPQYSYIDHYPNCDGEHDRWTKTVSGYTFLCYDREKHCIVE